MKKLLAVIAVIVCLGSTVTAQIKFQNIREVPRDSIWMTLTGDQATCPDSYETVQYYTWWNYSDATTGECIYVDEWRKGCIPKPGIDPSTLADKIVLPPPGDTISSTLEGIPTDYQQFTISAHQIDSGSMSAVVAPAISIRGDSNSIYIEGATVIFNTIQKADSIETRPIRAARIDSCRYQWESSPYLGATIGIHGNRAQYVAPSYGINLGIATMRSDTCTGWYYGGSIQFSLFPYQYTVEGCSSCDLQNVMSLLGFNGEVEIGKINDKKTLGYYLLGRTPALWPSNNRTVQFIPNRGIYAGLSWHRDFFSINTEVGGWETWGTFVTIRIYPFKL